MHLEAAAILRDAVPTLGSENYVELYRRFGFRQVAVRPGYYPAHSGREDALVLTLAL